MFPRRQKTLDRVLNYIKIHDGQTLLIQDIAEDLNLCRKTVSKSLRSLLKRELIKKDGKKYFAALI